MKLLTIALLIGSNAMAFDSLMTQQLGNFEITTGHINNQPVHINSYDMGAFRNHNITIGNEQKQCTTTNLGGFVQTNCY